MRNLSLFWIYLLLFITILFIIKGSLFSVEGMETVSGEKKNVSNMTSVDV